MYKSLVSLYCGFVFCKFNFSKKTISVWVWVNCETSVFVDVVSFVVVKQDAIEYTLNFTVLTGHLRGFYFHPAEEKHQLSFLPPLVELISCFLAVNKEAYCNPLDKYQAECGNQLKAICMSVLKPAARDFLSCHLS